MYIFLFLVKIIPLMLFYVVLATALLNAINSNSLVNLFSQPTVMMNQLSGSMTDYSAV